MNSKIAIWQRKSVGSCGKVCCLSLLKFSKLAEIFRNLYPLEANIYKTNHKILNRSAKNRNLEAVWR